PILIVEPVLELIVLGLAANLDVQDVRLMVVDADRSPTSREIAARIDASPAFELVGVAADDAVAEAALVDGTAELVVVVPEGTQRGLAGREPVDVPMLDDGTDANRGLLAQSYAAQVLARISAARAPMPAPPV